MKHIVYLLEIKRDELPNKYIGSKSNCDVLDGKIYKNGILYKTSSCDKLFVSALDIFEWNITILGEFPDYKTALSMENSIQIANDVIANPIFANRSYAQKSNFADPSYATYKHTITNKRARLPRNHPRVLNGEWVGVTKGTTLSENERKKRSTPLLGSKNHFYGKVHSPESKAIMAEKIGNAHRGKPKSDEHKRKQSEAAKRRWASYRENNTNREAESI